MRYAITNKLAAGQVGWPPRLRHWCLHCWQLLTSQKIGQLSESTISRLGFATPLAPSLPIPKFSPRLQIHHPWLCSTFLEYVFHALFIPRRRHSCTQGSQSWRISNKFYEFWTSRAGSTCASWVVLFEICWISFKIYWNSLKINDKTTSRN